ncbi:transposase [Rhodobacter sphaeroides]|nr:transposase [Cereibacter sphaeroides]
MKGELGKGVKEGRIWAYVRDQRPWSRATPPAVAYHFSPDRKGQHPQKHLGAGNGILQADANAGLRDLYLAEGNGAAHSRKQPVGRICEGPSSRSRKRPARTSPVRRRTGSERSTTSKRRSTAAVPTSAMLSGRSTAARRSRHSRSGPRRTSTISRARAIWRRRSATS